MIRAPTPPEQMMAWHSNALLGIYGDEVSNHGEDPECGWFRCRLAKGGPFVPARIWLQQIIDPDTGELTDDETLCCEVDGQSADPFDQWPWLCGHPITEAVWKYMVATRDWAEAHAPHNPEANPRQKIDWLTIQPPTF